MTCKRCQGLMVGILLDKELNGWIWGWRCANCGFLLDPRVMRIRMSRPSTPTAVDAIRPVRRA
jgi:hypothetical protein